MHANPIKIWFSVQVVKDSLTQKAGLLPNDFLISVAGGEVYEMTHDQVNCFQPKKHQKMENNGERQTNILLSGGASDPEGWRQVHHGH